MFKYIAKRFLISIPVVLGAMTLIFLLVYAMPGDPAAYVAGENAPAAVVEELRRQMGLDQPIHIQYWRYLSGLFHGDLGESVITKLPIAPQLAQAFPNTIALTIAAILWSTVGGVLMGIVAAVKRGGLVDRAVMGVAAFGVSFPSFSIALALLYVFAFQLPVFPLGGKGPNFYTWEGIRYLVLPAIALGFDVLAQIARMSRSSVLEVLGTDYVRTATAKGLGRWRVILKHALRPASLPIFTISGITIAKLLSGAVVIETVFAWPGVGRMIANAIMIKDITMIQGVMLLVVVITIGLNLLVDIGYGQIDPRIRY